MPENNFAEQIEYQVPWPPLKYRQAYTIVTKCVVLMRYLADNVSYIPCCRHVCLLLFMSLIAIQRERKATNALYAKSMGMLIETGLPNGTQTVTESSFVNVSWIVDPGPLHYQHHTGEIIDTDL